MYVLYILSIITVRSKAGSLVPLDCIIDGENLVESRPSEEKCPFIVDICEGRRLLPILQVLLQYGVLSQYYQVDARGFKAFPRAVLPTSYSTEYEVRSNVLNFIAVGSV
jgi:hypothetical protein